MTQVSCYAGSLPHFANHLAPIWKALPPVIKDGFYAQGRAAARADELGICVDGDFPRKKPLVMVASYEDYRACKDADIILVNHGVGQTYSDGKAHRHPSYSGGVQRERVVLHLCTSQRDADNCSGRTAICGVPYLDLHHLIGRKQQTDPPVVAISFHAEIGLVPETRSSFHHYRQAITRLAHQQDTLPFRLLGHAHPRNHFKMRQFWASVGIPYEEDWFEVLERADLYVCDNSSTMYEFASTDRPVLTLNAPWYRREVTHGLRFWDAIPGLQVDEPDALHNAICEALRDSEFHRKKREKAVQIAYEGYDDGHATERAVEAIVRLVIDG